MKQPFHSCWRFSSPSEGFTLLEVLVALVVFSIGVGGLMVGMGYHLKDISYIEDHAHAVRIASREMNALRRLNRIPEEETHGEEGRFVWFVQVEEMDSDTLPGMGITEENSRNAYQPCLMTVIVRWADIEGAEPTRQVTLKGIELFRKR